MLPSHVECNLEWKYSSVKHYCSTGWCYCDHISHYLRIISIQKKIRSVIYSACVLFLMLHYGKVGMRWFKEGFRRCVWWNIIMQILFVLKYIYSYFPKILRFVISLDTNSNNIFRFTSAIQIGEWHVQIYSTWNSKLAKWTFRFLITAECTVVCLEGVASLCIQQ